MEKLVKFYDKKQYDTTQRERVFKEFMYFDNILADTSKKQIKERTVFFDELFSKMIHFIDSVGAKNLDAKPTRFFKGNSEYFKPFDTGGQLNEFLPLTFTYFHKKDPDQPIGTLLYEPKSHKLLAWIILNQGGNYRYFLTFNLL